MTTHFEHKPIDPDDFEFEVGQRVDIEVGQFGETVPATIKRQFYHFHHGNAMIEVLTDDGETLAGCEYQAFAI